MEQRIRIVARAGPTTDNVISTFVKRAQELASRLEGIVSRVGRPASTKEALDDTDASDDEEHSSTDVSEDEHMETELAAGEFQLTATTHKSMDDVRLPASCWHIHKRTILRAALPPCARLAHVYV